MTVRVLLLTVLVKSLNIYVNESRKGGNTFQMVRQLKSATILLSFFFPAVTGLPTPFNLKELSVAG